MGWCGGGGGGAGGGLININVLESILPIRKVC